MDEYGAPAAPAAPFPYVMRTTSVLEHSRGIAWVADLVRDGVKVGTIEQEGAGGMDRVYVSDPAARAQWSGAVASAFGGDQESATFWLLVMETDQGAAPQTV